MKTMSCAQMGGPCEEKITAETPDEMIAKGMVHVEATHPEMAADIKATPQDDPKMVEWSKKFAEEWAATPDNA